MVIQAQWHKNTAHQPCRDDSSIEVEKMGVRNGHSQLALDVPDLIFLRARNSTGLTSDRRSSSLPPETICAGRRIHSLVISVRCVSSSQSLYMHGSVVLIGPVHQFFSYHCSPGGAKFSSHHHHGIHETKNRISDTRQRDSDELPKITEQKRV